MSGASTTKRPRSKTAPDVIAAAAVEVARAGLIDVVGADAVGDHLGVDRAGDRLVEHTFAAHQPGYRDWTWRVLVARASRARVATVCDSWLQPGEDAILAPSWVPWAQRLRPEDVCPTDRLAYDSEDSRLMEGYEATGNDSDVDHFALWELGLGRPRVLAPAGRDAAARRWQSGEFGAGNRAARMAEEPCSGCGFYLPLAGAMRANFGVCSNEWSAADGRVVSGDYGCGAHSETERRTVVQDIGEPIVDEYGYEFFAE